MPGNDREDDNGHGAGCGRTGWASAHPTTGRDVCRAGCGPMIERIVPVATLAATVGCGLMAGLFLAFSVAVMGALRRLPAPAGIAAMQSVNSAILNPVFGVLFGGTTILCLLLAVTAPFAAPDGATLRLTGGLLFLAGAFGVTIARNVPLNTALDAVDTTGATGAVGAGGARVWLDYLDRWTGWNHVRTLAATGATVALALTLPG
jgi:uncharacterized membrane protein